MKDDSSEATATTTTPQRVKPRWRGVSHQWAFFVSLLPGLLLVLAAPSARATTAAAIYAASLSALLGTSALYHRVHWSPRARFWLGRLDLSMIFVLIAGTYTPIGMLVLDGPLATTMLAIVWGAAFVGAIVQLLRVEWPKWASSLVYLGVGWVGIASFPQVVERVGLGALVLLAAGGILYSLGAVVYALQRPDPHPAVFGYHEIFHAFVVVAAALHFTAIAAYVVPIA